MIIGALAAQRPGENLAVSPGAVVLGITTQSINVAQLNHSITIPTVAAGDLLIVTFVFDGSSSTITPPSGWTLVVGQNSSSQVTTQIRYKIATGSEGGSSALFTIDNNRKSTLSMIRIQAGTFHAATAPERSFLSSSGTTPDAPTLSPTWGAGNTLWLAIFGADAAVTVSAYPLANGQALQSDALAGACTQGLCYAINNTATLDPGAFTISAAEEWSAFNVAIRAA